MKNDKKIEELETKIKILELEKKVAQLEKEIEKLRMETTQYGPTIFPNNVTYCQNN